MCLQASPKGDAGLRKQLEEKLLSGEQEAAAHAKSRLRELSKVSSLGPLKEGDLLKRSLNEAADSPGDRTDDTGGVAVTTSSSDGL